MNWTFFPYLHPVVNNCEYRPKLLMLPTYNPVADKKAVIGVRAALSTEGGDFDVMSLLDETNYFEGYVMFNVSLEIGYEYGDGQEGERGDSKLSRLIGVITNLLTLEVYIIQKFMHSYYSWSFHGGNLSTSLR
jgi:hypothetical protein